MIWALGWMHFKTFGTLTHPKLSIYYTKMVFDFKVWNVSPKFHGYAHTGHQIGPMIQ